MGGLFGDFSLDTRNPSDKSNASRYACSVYDSTDPTKSKTLFILFASTFQALFSDCNGEWAHLIAI